MCKLSHFHPPRKAAEGPKGQVCKRQKSLDRPPTTKERETPGIASVLLVWGWCSLFQLRIVSEKGNLEGGFWSRWGSVWCPGSSSAWCMDGRKHGMRVCVLRRKRRRWRRSERVQRRAKISGWTGGAGLSSGKSVVLTGDRGAKLSLFS